MRWAYIRRLAKVIRQVCESNRCNPTSTQSGIGGKAMPRHTASFFVLLLQRTATQPGIALALAVSTMTSRCDQPKLHLAVTAGYFSKASRLHSDVTMYYVIALPYLETCLDAFTSRTAYRTNLGPRPFDSASQTLQSIKVWFLSELPL